jgi:hypothetical protein
MEIPPQGKHPKVSLTLIEAPRTGAVVTAPPVLIASTHTIDYCCGYCGTVLMHGGSRSSPQCSNQMHGLRQLQRY